MLSLSTREGTRCYPSQKRWALTPERAHGILQNLIFQQHTPDWIGSSRPLIPHYAHSYVRVLSIHLKFYSEGLQVCGAEGWRCSSAGRVKSGVQS